MSRSMPFEGGWRGPLRTSPRFAKPYSGALSRLARGASGAMGQGHRGPGGRPIGAELASDGPSANRLPRFPEPQAASTGLR
jgi:hypothetical protein